MGKKKNKKIGPKEFTTICDANFRQICLGDKIELFGMIGTVVFTSGAYGIGFPEAINWDTVEKNFYALTIYNNMQNFCYNDNFISFWELLGNFDCEDNVCHVVEIVKTKKKIIKEFEEE